VIESAQPAQQPYAEQRPAPAPAQERLAQSFYAEPAHSAPVSSHGVYIEAIPASRQTYAAQEPLMEQTRAQAPEHEGPYIPPAPELPRGRMPQIDDFPRPIQEQYRQARGDYAHPSAAAATAPEARLRPPMRTTPSGPPLRRRRRPAMPGWTRMAAARPLAPSRTSSWRFRRSCAVRSIPDLRNGREWMRKARSGGPFHLPPGREIAVTICQKP
jgi:cell division protein FtsZ